MSKADEVCSPAAEWINLHSVLRRCWQTERAITRRALRTVRQGGRRRSPARRPRDDEKQVRKSLEALEFEFGLKRPVELRRHGNIYSDGSKGLMKILETEKALLDGNADEDQIDALVDYCTWDVRSMFKIARACQKLVDRE